jgi:hypothetical protein
MNPKSHAVRMDYLFQIGTGRRDTAPIAMDVDSYRDES